MNKLTFLIIILFYGMMAFSQKEVTKFNIDTSICGGEFLYKTKFIPKPFYAKYKKMTGFDFKIVNPNRSIQEGDIIRLFRKPLRRLIFILKKDNLYLLVIERGGAAMGISYIYFEYNNCKISNMNFLDFPLSTDKDYICKIIKTQDYVINNKMIP